MYRTDLRIHKNLKYDIPAGLVVFLVALPLCLGIALASGAPLFSGILAGIAGGLLVPLISRSSLSVSGPAAGLTSVILAGLADLGSFPMLLSAIVVGGCIQLVLGFIRAGSIAYFFPSSVIKGMLAAIGFILITKQLPLAAGYTAERIAINSSLYTGLGNFGHLITNTIAHIQPGAIIVCVVSLLIMIIWENTRLKKIAFLPSGLVVVIIGTLINLFWKGYYPSLALNSNFLVSLPAVHGISGLSAQFTFPDFSSLKLEKTWILAVTIGLVASVETLLSLEAVDQIDPFKRKSPLNRELLAQGTANIFCGLLGGLPVTAVIVRSSTNVSVGGRTKLASIVHGIFLLLAVAFLAPLLNLIPLSCLAAILVMVGYKLAKPALFIKMYKMGWSQFLPFIVAFVAIIATDLMIGIVIGLGVGIFYVIRTNFHTAVKVQKEEGKYVIRLRKDVSFLNKATLVTLLDRLPPSARVVIDGSQVEFIDHDIQEIIDNFTEKYAVRGNDVEVRTPIKRIKNKKT
jgi:MFS superfamily sulfate permease-like transporter